MLKYTYIDESTKNNSLFFIKLKYLEEEKKQNTEQSVRRERWKGCVWEKRLSSYPEN